MYLSQIRNVFVSNKKCICFKFQEVFVLNLKMIDLPQEGVDRAHNESTKSLLKFPSVKTDRETHSCRERED